MQTSKLAVFVPKKEMTRVWEEVDLEANLGNIISMCCPVHYLDSIRMKTVCNTYEGNPISTDLPGVAFCFQRFRYTYHTTSVARTTTPTCNSVPKSNRMVEARASAAFPNQVPTVQYGSCHKKLSK